MNAYNGTIVNNITTGGIFPSGLIAFDSSLQLPATTCLALRAPTDGAVLGCPGNAGANYDTVCQFSCNSGYIGYGSQERRCQHDGTWSGKEFVCQTVTCTLPTNGVLLGCKTNTTEMSYNAECRFSCKESVEEMSPTVRICAENGSWSETDVGCTGILRHLIQTEKLRSHI
ncbi:E-selectin-like isoform X2 [Stylophora pistillata]|uniref:E-selectin-like isoform X2 n=1 Tax=Stylophora pistillata TaxID=50429 RepID=UPI000C050DB8|nr:E-selectin-like isoform X2 [Stylophora pistillata]XP_022793593.1 E-selectin-like isoform X2 [Stylophora pistillata]